MSVVFIDDDEEGDVGGEKEVEQEWKEAKEVIVKVTNIMPHECIKIPEKVSNNWFDRLLKILYQVVRRFFRD